MKEQLIGKLRNTEIDLPLKAGGIVRNTETTASGPGSWKQIQPASGPGV